MGKLIRYFFYLAWHWNLPLAVFMMHHEIKGEKKYRLRTSGIRHLPKDIPGSHDLLPHASINQPANFFILEKLFECLDDESRQTRFVDVGCGLGRVLAVAACKGFRKLSGIDIVPHWVDETNNMLSRHECCKEAEIVVQVFNASLFEIPADTGVIFLFNPFDKAIMDPLANRTLHHLKKHPRRMLLLYANPVHKSCWMAVGFKEIRHFRKMQYLEGSVLEYLPA